MLLSSGAAACGSGSSTSASSTTTAAVPSTVATGPGVGRPPVVLGTKNFTEEFILGQLYAQALRAKGFRVTLMNNLGASEVIERKLASGTVDAYPEYTGTILSTLAHQTSRPASAYTAYQRAASFERAHGATLLAMAPAQDTDVLVTKPAYAARHRLRSLADLVRLGSSVTLAAPPEFRTRFNGLVGLRQVYGVGAVRFVPVKIGTQYRALEQGQAQVAAVFTTDGNLSQGGYTLLEDPRDMFGFQNVTFVIRKDTLAREGPDFQRTVDAVSARLSTQALRVMNAAVDLDQQSPDAVARQFLRANGLI
ncbi:MAG: ABC transporter substrate-binding protein [Solirubrobacteraceae bacterium]